MAWIKRHWTALEADEWTHVDWIVIVLSPLIYGLLMVGLALAIVLNVWGFVAVGIGLVLTVVMHWIIDPKLKAVSEEYEKRQHMYLEQLERKARWKSE